MPDSTFLNALKIFLFAFLTVLICSYFFIEDVRDGVRLLLKLFVEEKLAELINW